MNPMKRRTFLLTTARPAVVGAWLLLDLLFIPAMVKAVNNRLNDLMTI